MTPFRTALHSVSYAGSWGQCCLTLDEFVAKAAGLGFDAVMLTAKRPHLSVLDFGAAQRQRLREQLSRLDLRVACLAGYNDFGLGAQRPEIPTGEMQILYVRELCRLARDLDCSLVRLFTAYPSAGTSHDRLWDACVSSLRECARQAEDFDVTIGVQNHHDLAAGYESLLDLLVEIDRPNCKAMFDAWAPALHGDDPAAAVARLAPFIAHTTVADYVRRPRYRYQPELVNYERQPDLVRAVPMGDGFIDYRAFLTSLAMSGYSGYVAYEMCSPIQGGGSEENLDRCARRFVAFMREPFEQPAASP